MCNCRIFNRYDLPFSRGKHKVIKASFTCPICNHNKNRFSVHLRNKYNDDGNYRDFECNYCHDYIRQNNYLGNLDKEFFFALDYCVVMSNNKVTLTRSGYANIELPFFIFESKEQLIRKIQTYTMFS